MNTSHQPVESDVILQCGLCHRQHDGAGAVLKFVPCVPALMPCGLPDCAAIVERFLADEKAKRARRMVARAERREGKQECRSAKAERCEPHGLHRKAETFERPPVRMPHPSDRDLPEPSALAGNGDPDGVAIPEPRPLTQGIDLPPVVSELPHKERQRDFVAQGKGDGDNERMMELLCDGFDLFDAARVARGPWISKQDFIYKHHIATPNSRASELRGSETHVGHPLVNEYRLEIDQSSDKEITKQEGSCYSVCFVEHSIRLARERAAAEKGQKTFED